MLELIKYYEKTMCPYCLNYNTQSCNKDIELKELNNVKNILCQNYLKEPTQEELDNKGKPEGIYTLPAKYYSKNFKEI